MTSDPTLLKAFAPTGKLRASINLGNPILANRNAATGEAGGVSVDLAREFAARLGVDTDLVVFDTAAKSVEAVTTEAADIGFFAIDPLRGAGIAFTAPYVLIEGCYLVRDASPLTRNEDVDREGNRIMVGEGSAYDLFLTRELKRATIVRAADAGPVMDLWIAGKLDAVAGVKPQLEADAKRVGGLRLLPQRFMAINQAMGTPRSRESGARYLRAFIDDLKATGFVAQAFARNRIDGASLAP